MAKTSNNKKAKKGQDGVVTSSFSSSSSSSSSSNPKSITVGSGFFVLPVTFPSSVPVHYVYCRPHSPKSDQENQFPSGKTLFIANLPIDTTEKQLRELFKRAGTILRVKFGQSGIRFDGQESQDEEDEESETSDQEEVAAAKNGKKAKRKQTTKEGPPPLVPLEIQTRTFLTTSSSAYVVFLDESSYERAINFVCRGETVKWPLVADEEVGLEYLLQQYAAARPELEMIESHSTSVVARYQYYKANPKKKKLGVKAVSIGPNGELLDEDGFVIIQRSGKYGRAEGGVAVAKASHLSSSSQTDDSTTKKKSKELQDFYRFQIREKKREKLADLRAQFEADKAKIAKLKANRRFNPY